MLVQLSLSWSHSLVSFDRTFLRQLIRLENNLPNLLSICFHFSSGFSVLGAGGLFTTNSNPSFSYKGFPTDVALSQNSTPRLFAVTEGQAYTVPAGTLPSFQTTSHPSSSDSSFLVQSNLPGVDPSPSSIDSSDPTTTERLSKLQKSTKTSGDHGTTATQTDDGDVKPMGTASMKEGKTPSHTSGEVEVRDKMILPCVGAIWFVVLD